MAPHKFFSIGQDEQTFIMAKPDAVQRGIVGEIIKRFEAKGFKLVAMKMLKVERELAQQHYSDLSEKPFFAGLVNFITSSPVVAMVWEGSNAAAAGRKLLGETNPLNSLPGTIRGDLCTDIGRNIIHGSDSPESAKKEIALWFPEGVCSWTPCQQSWVYEYPLAQEDRANP